MTRRKTFRKRRQKRVQKGGAARKIQGIINNESLPEFGDAPTKYYGMVQKTRKYNGGGGGGGGLSIMPSEYEYKSFIVNEAQKSAICANAEDKAKMMVEETSGGDSFQKFYENEDKAELITFFEFANGGGHDKKLEDLKINTVADVDWENYVGC